ncbi:MAG: lysyl oxidase family protein [Flavobacteriales bacterium]
MLKHYALRALVACAPVASALLLNAQCSTTNGTSCLCAVGGQTNCDLLPDITISWKALESYAGGPSEYAQNDASNPGRLRVTGSTPNIGHGALNVRGVDQNGYRWFLCGTDTFSINDPMSTQTFTCPNSQTPKQLILQRVYHKNGNGMTFTERFAGTMTYHPSHGHNHVDDWAIFTLRSQTTDPNPLNWPILGNGAKVGFCLMDYYSCTNGSADGHCRTAQQYGAGTPLTSSSQFQNYGHGGGAYNCSQISQGISVGYTDVYSESLDGMWINIPPGTCNGNYWVVMQVDPNNNFLEENDNNNWTAAPVTLTLQVPAGGDFAQITASGSTNFCEGGSVQLTATLGNSYLWSNGATTQSISAVADGNYSCTVTGTCGTDASLATTVSVIETTEPIGTGATITGPGSASLQATGGDVHWFDLAIGGTEMGTGNNFNTPVISNSTTYYAEDHTTQAGLSGYTGKTTNTGGGAYGSYTQYLIFDALQAFELKSVKVYANSAGTRTFQVLSSSGSLVTQATVSVPAGESRVNLNLNIPQGNDQRLTVTSTLQDLYRNNAGVTYPYTLAGLVSVKNSSAGTQYYYYCYDWEVDEGDMVCSSGRTAVTATVNSGVLIAPVAKLEGPFDSNTGLMRDDLRVAGLIPAGEPFTALGFTQAGGGGGETLTQSLLTTTGPTALVDWVLVELRSAGNPATIVATRSALLRRNGQVVSPTGGTLQFSQPGGNYYVAVRHRNHLGCATAAPVALSANSIPVDFTTANTATWGTQARKDVNGTQLLWMGNGVRDGEHSELKYTGTLNDRDPILTAIGGTIPTSTISGYYVTDHNLDGVVKYTGTLNDRDPILTNVGGTVPTNTRAEQLP